MRIVQLKAENVKRLQAVEINPTDNMVVIGGKNGAGKSSVLDSIMYVLAGKREICDRPLRDGEKKGSVTINLDNGLIATRVFTAKGDSRIEVTSADGAKYSSPQALLDNLCSSLMFDPLAFINLDSSSQLTALQKIVGLDFTEMNTTRAGLFQQRTIVNREVKSLASQVKGMCIHAAAPDEEISVLGLTSKLQEAYDINTANAEVRGMEEQVKKRAVGWQEKIDEIDRQIALLTQKKTGAQEELKKCHDAISLAREQAARLEDVDTDAIREQISKAEKINHMVRENKATLQAKARLDAAQGEADKLTAKIEAIDAEKINQLSRAEFPVAGLGFDEDRVLFNGVPFSQSSSAEQLRVSAAMAAAMNPELRIMLIRDGSLLDDDSVKLLTEFAVQNDFQVWLERVGNGDECSVIIEDGCVAGQTIEQPETAGA